MIQIQLFYDKSNGEYMNQIQLFLRKNKKTYRNKRGRLITLLTFPTKARALWFGP